MLKLKIRVYKGGSEAPSTTISVPLGVIRLASRLVPKRARASMEAEGIDLAEIALVSESEEARGVLLEVEEHDKGERMVISVE